jgi:hypothetical protein
MSCEGRYSKKAIMQTQVNISTETAGVNLTRRLIIQKALLGCGILSSVLYITGISLGALRWAEYSPISQSVSELFAIDAPSASFTIPVLVLYALLIYLFGMGIWRSAGSKRTLRIAAVLIISKEILGVIATIITPMHLRGSEGTLSDTLHAILTGVGVLLCMLPAIGFGAASFGKHFRNFSIVTMVVFLTFGILAGMEGPRVAVNLSTPQLGVYERVNIFTYMVWIVVLAVTLLHDHSNKPELWISKRSVFELNQLPGL